MARQKTISYELCAVLFVENMEVPTVGIEIRVYPWLKHTHLVKAVKNEHELFVTVTHA